MRDLKDLRSVADQSLAGLQADERLRQRILHAAREETPRRQSRRWIPAVALAAVAVLVGAAVLISSLQQPDLPNIRTIAAGDGDNQPAQTANANPVNHAVSISTGNRQRSGSLWGSGQDGNDPIICLDGRVYRMLTEPVSVSDSLLSDTAWQIETYTTEPSLSDLRGTVSNIAPSGASAYGIRGMEHTLAAAEVDGQMRLFQRVSFNGTALLGDETLSDALPIAGHIREMTLSGVGSVSDTSACEKLFQVLLDNAEYDSPSALSDAKTLRIVLDNGLSLQMAYSKEKLSACGTWSCPEFIDAFTDAAE